MCIQLTALAFTIVNENAFFIISSVKALRKALMLAAAVYLWICIKFTSPSTYVALYRLIIFKYLLTPRTTKWQKEKLYSAARAPGKLFHCADGKFTSLGVLICIRDSIQAGT